MEITLEQIIKTIGEIAYIPDLDGDTELIESGLIDSFDMISLISEITYTYGVEVPVVEIDPINFATARDILETLMRLKR